MTLDRPSAPDVHALRVTVTRGPDRGRTAVVSRGSVIVGRANGAGLRLSDVAVSSFHVELSARADGVEVRDLASHNGTFFGGARLGSATVPSGALLEVGASVIHVELEAELAVPDDQLASFGALRGTSPAMRSVFAVLSRVAPTPLSVLLEGAAGTGKQLAARAIHEASRQAAGPFVTQSCAAFPAGLGDSILFGDGRSLSVLDAAEGGTLLLTDLSELPQALQARLLAVLDGRERGPRPRVLAATRRDIREMVNASTFLEGLYLLLAQARVVMPPLSARPEDIAPLAYHFLQSMPADAEGARAIAREGLDELRRREYRGNVRELRATVERASLVARGQTITAGDLAFERLLTAERERAASANDLREIAPFKEAKRTLVDEFERDYLKALLLRAGENLSRASALSGVERHHLRDLFRKHDLWGK
jgi:DNA-binding NtrC family response regulator